MALWDKSWLIDQPIETLKGLLCYSYKTAIQLLLDEVLVLLYVVACQEESCYVPY